MNLDKNIETVFNLLNQARGSPQDLISKYKSLLSNFNGRIFRDCIKTREGVAAVDDLITDLRTRQRLAEKLKWSFGLHMLADQKARLLAESNSVTTDGSPSHRGLQQRAKEFVVLKGRASEVCEFGGTDGEEIVQWLLIDDGLASRKRRRTLLDPAFKYIGIGTALHETYGLVTVVVLAEDVVSLVAPGRDGHYIRREPVQQGQVMTLRLEDRKTNQKDMYSKSVSGFSTVNKVVPVRSGLSQRIERE